MSAPIGVIVLAAGLGTRMRSALPKVLHPVCGRPMALHVVRAAREALAGRDARIAVVVGHGADRVREALTGDDLLFVDQPELIGTADAVRRCREALAGCGEVLVLNGDCPLITPDLVSGLLGTSPAAPVRFAAATVPDPGRLGRVECDERGAVKAIVEAADDTTPRTGPTAINGGQYGFDAAWLWSHIERVPVSAKGEYYLTHLVSLAYEAGTPAATVACEPEDVLGVDDRVRLAEAEAILRTRILRGHMLAGVTITDPATTYIDAGVELAQDVTILPGCHLRGATRVETGTVIGPATTLRHASVGPASEVVQSSVEDSKLGANVHLGPFAHVRGNSTIGDGCHLGNYAEVNRSTLGRGVKMHHFSYLGDATVGDGANIAAGVITCNYDGVNKHPTTIGAGAFVGCDTMLVAPVAVGDGAKTGAGTVVTRDLPAGVLAVGVPARILRQEPGAGT